MNIPDAGRLLGISRTAAYNAANTGDIPIIKIGGRKLVPTARLRQMLGITSSCGDAEIRPWPSHAIVVGGDPRGPMVTPR